MHGLPELMMRLVLLAAIAAFVIGIVLPQRVLSIAFGSAGLAGVLMVILLPGPIAADSIESGLLIAAVGLTGTIVSAFIGRFVRRSFGAL